MSQEWQGSPLPPLQLSSPTMPIRSGARLRSLAWDSWARPAPSDALQRKTSAGRENEDCEKRSVSPCGPATQTPPDECSETSTFGASLLCATEFAEETAEAMG